MTVHTEPDDRIAVKCLDCNRAFMALGEWQTRCRVCYAKFKGKTATPVSDARFAALETEIAELRAQLRAAQADADRWRRLALAKPTHCKTAPPIPPDHWRRLVQLAHPDRHGGSVASNEATTWLLENRP